MKFGLIVPDKKKEAIVQAPKKAQVASIFAEDDYENDEEKELATLRKAKAAETVSKSISSSNEFIDKIQKDALEEDPNIFDYDASIEEDSKRKKTVHRNLRIKDEVPDDGTNKNEPKYMYNILAKAEERKIESELIKLRNMKRKSGTGEPEEEVFVTSAYRQRLKELEEKEKELKIKQSREEDGDVTKRKDMSGFYYNLMKRNVSFGGKPAEVVDNSMKKPKTEVPKQPEQPKEPETPVLSTTVETNIEEDEPVVFGPRRPQPTTK